MTALRLREWPRLVAVGCVLAVVFVLIGVLVGSATSGGSRGPARVALAAPVSSAQVSQLRHQVSAENQTIAGLRASLQTADARLARARHAARVAKARLHALKSRTHHQNRR